MIRDLEQDQILFLGNPLNHSIEKLIQHPKENFAILVFPYKEGPHLYPDGPLKAFNNLISINEKGKVLWIAELPTNGFDFYDSIFWSPDFPKNIFTIKLNFQEESLIALSYSGFLVEIDPKTGKSIQEILVK